MQSVSLLGDKTKNFLARSKYLGLAVVLAFAMATASTAAVPRKAAAARRSPSIYQCERYRPTLYKGVSGQAACVAALQGFLHHQRMQWLDIDGIFGNETKLGVAYWQGNYGLTQDGVVGPSTWNKIRWICDSSGIWRWYCGQTYAY